jgi:hypothetical protein
MRLGIEGRVLGGVSTRSAPDSTEDDVGRGVLILAVVLNVEPLGGLGIDEVSHDDESSCVDVMGLIFVSCLLIGMRGRGRGAG